MMKNFTFLCENGDNSSWALEGKESFKWAYYGYSYNIDGRV
jgi:hypothetical protein